MHSIALIIIIYISFAGSSHAQNQYSPNKNIIKHPNAIQSVVKTINENTKNLLNFKNNNQNQIRLDLFQLKILSPNFSFQHQGWFCKFEYKIRQKTAIPLYIRLGSKELTDNLEGKHR
jgi:hypothetical protein